MRCAGFDAQKQPRFMGRNVEQDTQQAAPESSTNQLHGRSEHQQDHEFEDVMLASPVKPLDRITNGSQMASGGVSHQLCMSSKALDNDMKSQKT